MPSCRCTPLEHMFSPRFPLPHSPQDNQFHKPYLPVHILPSPQPPQLSPAPRHTLSAPPMSSLHTAVPLLPEFPLLHVGRELPRSRSKRPSTVCLPVSKLQHLIQQSHNNREMTNCMNYLAQEVQVFCTQYHSSLYALEINSQVYLFV